MAKQPKIRFKGFTEEWNEAPLGQLVKEHRVSNQFVHHQNLLSLSYGKIVRRDIHANKGLLPASFDTYQIIDKDTIVFRVTDLQNDKRSLRVAISEEEGIISPAYVCVDTISDEITASFLHQILHYHDVITKIYYKMGDGLRQTLNYSDLKSLNIVYPNPDEQKTIASIFGSIDSTITNRETELEKLKNIKRALLEKLFPQDGQSIPAIRFKGFESKWSDVPFGKLIIENKEVSTVENEDTLLSSAIEGMFLNSELFDHQRGQSNIGYRKITKGMLILSAQNLHLGNANVNLRFDHGIVSPAYKTYNIQGADTEFMAVWVKREETKAFFDRATTAGASKCRKNIDWDDLYQQNLAMPLDDEQKKIGKFILTLDRLITLREKYIKQLKHSKQALLEQMFVNN